MKIGFDARSCYYKINGGIGQYTKNIIENLLAQNDYDYFYLFQKFPNNEIKKNKKNCKVIWTPWIERFEKYRGIWEEKILPLQINLSNIDIFHSPDHFLPREELRCKKIVTIHDVAPFVYPLTKTESDNQRYKAKLLHSSMNANLILTVSNFSKCEIIKYLNVNEKKIEVIYPGLNIEIPRFTDEMAASIEQKFNLPEKYILHVGTIEPRKNIKILVDLFAILDNSKYRDYYLVLVGSDGWLYEDFYKYVERKKITKKVLRLKNVNGKYLPYIYKKAKVLILPSLYEGFGFPLLEAMACGVPIIASNCSSIPEVLNGAGELFDNSSVDDLYMKVKNMFENEDYRNTSIIQGFNRAKDFSWEKHVTELYNVYKRMMGTKL